MVSHFHLDELESEILLVISREKSTEEEIVLKICKDYECKYDRNRIFNSIIKLVDDEYVDLTIGPNYVFFYSIKEK